MNKIQFIIYGDPISQGRPKARRQGEHARVYMPAKVKAAERNILAQAISYRPEKPLKGGIILSLKFFKPKPKSYPKKRKLNIVKPDLTNMEKLVEDALNKVFWEDDARIFCKTSVKLYGEPARTEVEIQEINPDENYQIE